MTPSTKLADYRSIAELFAPLMRPTKDDAGELAELIFALLRGKNAVDKTLLSPLIGGSKELHQSLSLDPHVMLEGDLGHVMHSTGILGMWDDLHNKYLRSPAASLEITLRQLHNAPPNPRIDALLQGLSVAEQLPDHQNLSKTLTEQAQDATYAALVRHYTAQNVDEPTVAAEIVCGMMNAATSAKSQTTVAGGGLRTAAERSFLLANYGGAKKAAESTANLFEAIAAYTGINLDRDSKLHSKAELIEELGKQSSLDGMSDIQRLALAYALHHLVHNTPPIAYTVNHDDDGYTSQTRFTGLPELMRLGLGDNWQTTIANTESLAEYAGYTTHTVPLLLSTSARWLSAKLASAEAFTAAETVNLRTFLRATAEACSLHDQQNTVPVIQQAHALLEHLPPHEAIPAEALPILNQFIQDVQTTLAKRTPANNAALEHALNDCQQHLPKPTHKQDEGLGSIFGSFLRRFAKGRTHHGGET